MKKLPDVEIPLANFFASSVLALREKLGPILWQLPPNFGRNQTRLTKFFELLPRTAKQAGILARKHSDKLKAPAWTKIGRKQNPLSVLSVWPLTGSVGKDEGYIVLAKKLKEKRDVFVYFDNDAKVHAPFDAIRLAKRLGVNW